MIKVFIDGRAGTTGLRIWERFENRPDVEILTLPEERRKDAAARKEMINASDVTFLCLPDDAAREAVAMVENNTTKLIDASTAHRTQTDWAYGFPELDEALAQKIKTGRRVAVPGCHAAGFLSLVYPLQKADILPKDYPLVCHSLTGYSGGGNQMIEEYRQEGELLKSPRQYGLSQQHKHLKEMQAIASLADPPLFNPIVSNFYSGMLVTVPLYAKMLKGSYGAKRLFQFFCDYYARAAMVSVLPFAGEGVLNKPFLPANLYSGKDFMKIYVDGNEDRIVLSALFDNLGKGASGAAIQCMNLMFNLEETTGLVKE